MDMDRGAALSGVQRRREMLASNVNKTVDGKPIKQFVEQMDANMRMLINVEKNVHRLTVEKKNLLERKLRALRSGNQSFITVRSIQHDTTAWVLEGFLAAEHKYLQLLLDAATQFREETQSYYFPLHLRYFMNLPFNQPEEETSL